MTCHKGKQKQGSPGDEMSDGEILLGVRDGWGDEENAESKSQNVS